MKLTFLYHPVTDVEAATTFFRDELELEEAWRDGESTVAFWLSDRSAQVMCSLTDQPPGPMYLVDDLDDWITAHPALQIAVAREDIPGGAVAGFDAPGDNTFYVFDQPDA